jgi:hypothetical protein
MAAKLHATSAAHHTLPHLWRGRQWPVTKQPLDLLFLITLYCFIAILSFCCEAYHFLDTVYVLWRALYDRTSFLFPFITDPDLDHTIYEWTTPRFNTLFGIKKSWMDNKKNVLVALDRPEKRETGPPHCWTGTVLCQPWKASWHSFTTLGWCGDILSGSSSGESPSS